MTVSILTLGIIANYTSLGQPARKCQFNSTTTLQFANSPSSPSIPYTSTTMTPTSFFTNSANSSSNLSFINSTASALNTTESKSTLASKGMRYFTLSALVLFVGAYSFSFGPGELFSFDVISRRTATYCCFCYCSSVICHRAGFHLASKNLNQSNYCGQSQQTQIAQRNRRQARENACKQIKIGFASRWLIKLLDFC